MDHNDRMIITGGIAAGSYVMVNNYEAMRVVRPNFNPVPWAQGTYDMHTPASSPADRVFAGPNGPDVLYFDYYPRMHMLTDGALLYSGLTHHTDMDTRYVELVSQPGPGSSRDFLTPANAKRAPRGYYMLFLVTNEGIPSVASWVHLGG